MCITHVPHTQIYVTYLVTIFFSPLVDDFNFYKMPVLRNLLRGVTRGANRHKEMTSKRGNKNFHPNTSRIQPTGYGIKTKWRNVKEMIPEIVVPSLEDFPLKAYVSYKCPDTQQDPLTPREIFDKCIAPQVLEDLKSGKYDNTATSLAASENKPSQSDS